MGSKQADQKPLNSGYVVNNFLSSLNAMNSASPNVDDITQAVMADSM